MNHRFSVPVAIRADREMTGTVDLLVLEHVGNYPRLSIQSDPQFADRPRVLCVLLYERGLYPARPAHLPSHSLAFFNGFLQLERLGTAVNLGDEAALDLGKYRFLNHNLASVHDDRSVECYRPVHGTEFRRDIDLAARDV